MPPPPPPTWGSPELDLFRAALRPVWDARTIALLQDAAGRCVVPGRLTEVASAEGAASLLHAAIVAAGAVVPPPDAHSLHAGFLLAGAMSGHQDRRLVEIVRALEGRGIDVLAFKGPTLAHRLYDPPWLRASEDLDVLVPRGAFEAAGEVLVGLGYRDLVGKPAALRRLEERADRTRTVVNGEGVSVDLHGALSKAGFPVAFDEAGMRRRAVAVPIDGVPVRTFAPEDLLLYLCAHGCKDLWRRRIWIGDVARLLVRHPEMDGDRVAAAARRSGTVRCLGIGLALVAEVVGASAPQPALARAGEDRRCRVLARRMMTDGSLDVRASGAVWRVLRFNQSLRERPRDRLSMLLGSVFVPRVGEFRALPLPNALVPLYPLLRPLRLAGVYARRWRGRAR